MAHSSSRKLPLPEGGGTFLTNHLVPRCLGKKKGNSLQPTSDGLGNLNSRRPGGQLRPAPFPPYEAAPGAARFALTPLVDGESRWVTPTDEENLKRRRGDVFFVVIGQIRLEKKHVLNYIELIEDSLRISD